MLHVTALALALVVSGNDLDGIVDEPPRELQFDGETYHRDFVATTEQGDLAEYVSGDETVENWTKLVAVRVFPGLDDPIAAAAGVARALKQSNPAANFQLLEKEDKSEALVDFLTWPKDASYVEFNVFRYIKDPDAAGLVCYQFAYRFQHDGSRESIDKFKEQRQHWLETMREVDLPLDFAQ